MLLFLNPYQSRKSEDAGCVLRQQLSSLVQISLGVVPSLWGSKENHDHVLMTQALIHCIGSLHCARTCEPSPHLLPRISH